MLACLAIMFGLLAPTFTRLLLAAPKSLVMTLAGLAMLRVLQQEAVSDGHVYAPWSRLADGAGGESAPIISAKISFHTSKMKYFQNTKMAPNKSLEPDA